MYDFASATSNSKVNQETKHIYILQNALKKSPSLSKKPTSSTILSEAIVNQTDIVPVEGRSSEDADSENSTQQNAMGDLTLPAESRAQNLHNFKQRKRVLKSVEDDKEDEESEAEQLLDNHAIVYRVRQRYVAIVTDTRDYPDGDLSDSPFINADGR